MYTYFDDTLNNSVIKTIINQCLKLCRKLEEVKTVFKQKHRTNKKKAIAHKF